jgi:hypothetical protein
MGQVITDHNKTLNLKPPIKEFIKKSSKKPIWASKRPSGMHLPNMGSV